MLTHQRSTQCVAVFKVSKSKEIIEEVPLRTKLMRHSVSSKRPPRSLRRWLNQVNTAFNILYPGKFQVLYLPNPRGTTHLDSALEPRLYDSSLWCGGLPTWGLELHR